MIRLDGGLEEGFGSPLVSPERIQENIGLEKQGVLGPGKRVGLCQGLQTMSKSHPRAVAWSGLPSCAEIPLGDQV